MTLLPVKIVSTGEDIFVVGFLQSGAICVNKAGDFSVWPVAELKVDPEFLASFDPND